VAVEQIEVTNKSQKSKRAQYEPFIIENTYKNKQQMLIRIAHVKYHE